MVLLVHAQGFVVIQGRAAASPLRLSVWGRARASGAVCANAAMRGVLVCVLFFLVSPRTPLPRVLRGGASRPRPAAGALFAGWCVTHVVVGPLPALIPAQGTRSDQSWYEKIVKPIATCRTVEEFWRCYSHLVRPNELVSPSDYHLFKQGISPLWEDEANQKGGKWMVRLRKGLASEKWER